MSSILSMLAMPCSCLFQTCHTCCLFKRNGNSTTPALPWCANASLYPQLGDYHHSGGICLNRGVWMEGARGGDLCWNHNTEPYTIKANTSATSTNCALLQVSVSLPAFQTVETPPRPLSGGTNPVFSRKPEMGGSPNLGLSLTFTVIAIEMNDIKCADVRSHGSQGDP